MEQEHNNQMESDTQQTQGLSGIIEEIHRLTIQIERDTPTDLNPVLERINRLDQTLKEIAVAVTSVNSKVTSLDSKLNSIDSKINSLDTILDGISTSVSGVSTTATEIKTEVEKKPTTQNFRVRGASNSQAEIDKLRKALHAGAGILADGTDGAVGTITTIKYT